MPLLFTSKAVRVRVRIAPNRAFGFVGLVDFRSLLGVGLGVEIFALSLG